MSLIAPLQRASETGSLSWTIDENGSYALSIGENTLTLSRAFSEFSHVWGYTFQVLDSSKKTVDWVGAYEKSDEGFAELDRLYEVVDRRTRNVDGVLSDILHRLEAVTGTSG
jgi:hypothetical protein